MNTQIIDLIERIEANKLKVLTGDFNIVEIVLVYEELVNEIRKVA